MAVQLIGSNINQWGDQGRFESDPSTWGFTGDSYYSITRISTSPFEGSYCLRATSIHPLYQSDQSALAVCAFIPVPTKKYIFKARVRVPSSLPIAVGATGIGIALPQFATFLSETTKTVSECMDTWQEITLQATNMSPFGFGIPTITYIALRLVGGGIASTGGYLDVDKFEIYEYEDVIIPPVCTLAINETGTAVSNETAPGANNGSITVAITGAINPVQYRINSGGWQVSNVFPALAGGAYTIEVKEDTTNCTDTASFTVMNGSVAFDFSVYTTNESTAGANDGSIQLSPSGPGAPFQYSINGGSSFAGTNVFSNLAPGTYAVVVKNASGIILAKQTTVQPGIATIEKFYLSKNYITKELQAATGWQLLTNYRLYLDLRVEDVFGSGNYVSKLEQELPPDADGKTVFYLQEALRGVFTIQPPALHANTLRLITDRSKRFKTFTGALQADQVTPVTLTESLPNMALYGGVSKIHAPTIASFSSYLKNKKKWLTWAPLIKVVDAIQEDYLTFYCYDNIQTLTLKATVYFSDATSQTVTLKSISGTTYTQLYEVPAGPSNSGVLLVNVNKIVTRYDLWLENQSSQVITEVRIFYITESKPILSRYYLFLNSLGAFETIRFSGVRSRTTGVTKELSQKFLTHTYQPNDGEYLVHTVLLEEKQNISSGYVQSMQAKEWHDYMKQFIASELIYDVTDGVRKPMVITSATHSEEDQNYEWYVRMDAKTAYDDVVYTPDLI